MRRLDRYLLRRYLFSLSLSILGLVLVAVVIDLTESLDTFIDFQATPGQVLLYYAYHTPYWIVLTLPVAALLGTLFSLTTLARRNEITAMKALGVGLHRLLLPLFVFALGFSGLAFLFNDRVVPEATHRCNAIREAMSTPGRGDGSRRQVLLQDVAGQLLNARTYDAVGRRARQVCWERLEKDRPVERVAADTLAWRQDHWVATRGTHFLLGTDGTRAVPFDTLSLAGLTLKPEDLAREQRRPEEMTYAELDEYIRRAAANGEDATRQVVDLNLKISFPVTCFIIVLLGGPLGANARRAGLTNRFGVGILICFAFYGCVKGGQALGWNQVLPPWLGAWAANLVFAALSAVLLWRAHK